MSRRLSRSPGAAGTAFQAVARGVAVGGEADGADAAGKDLERQHAGGEVLRFGEDARGDVAARDDGVLEAGHDLADAAAAEAAPRRRIAGQVGRLASPGEPAGSIVEADFVNREAGGFVLGQTFGGRRFARRQADVGAAFQLLPQRALALLLALDFLRRRFFRRRRDGRCGQAREQEGNEQPEQAAGPSRAALSWRPLVLVIVCARHVQHPSLPSSGKNMAQDYATGCVGDMRTNTHYSRRI